MVSSFDRANEHVLRSLELIEAQRARVREFERRGWNAQPAQALLTIMLHALRLMVEHRDRLKEDGTVAHAGSYEALTEIRENLAAALVRRTRSPILNPNEPR